jgi:1,2-diacylglycerol 3-beta-galactosyltransferase
VPAVDRESERRKLGLDPHKPTALILFGGFGSKVMKGLLEKLEASRLELQAIFIAGRNEGLKAELEQHRASMQRHVVGFTTEVPYYMQLADFFIGKPGPGSISEAVHMGLPVLTVSNSMTLPQERYNARWLVEKDLGVLLKSWSGVAEAAHALLGGDTLERFRANARNQDNRAIFEIPEILAQLM